MCVMGIGALHPLLAANQARWQEFVVAVTRSCGRSQIIDNEFVSCLNVFSDVVLRFARLPRLGGGTHARLPMRGGGGAPCYGCVL